MDAGRIGRGASAAPGVPDHGVPGDRSADRSSATPVRPSTSNGGWATIALAGAGALALGAGVLAARSGGSSVLSRSLMGGGIVALGASLLTACSRGGDRQPTRPTPPTPPTPVPTPLPTTGVPMRLAQLNAQNLFDTVDQPRVQDEVLSPEAYDRKLTKLALTIRDVMGSPDVIALQEVENEQVLRDLAARPEVRDLGYVPLIVEGSDPRGIDVAYLYRPGTTELVGHEQLQTTYRSPAGRNIKLFTRPPLVATFRTRGGSDGAQQGAALTVVNNHFTSKLQGDDGAAKRLLQAAFVASIADGRAGAANLDPSRVVVLGDLNEDLDDPAYLSLVTAASEGAPAPRVNAATHLPEADRYSWRDGRTRTLLDHVLLTPTLDATVRGVRIPHVNSDPSERFADDPTTPQRASDHDPVVVDLAT